MQLQFRIDDNNYVTFAFQLENPGDNGFASGPEIISAAIVDSKLSNIEKDQLIDLAGQLIDFETSGSRTGGIDPTEREPDWRAEFLAACK